METIDRQAMQTMIDEDDVVVIEVLDPEDFHAFHLPDAVNVPLGGDIETEIRSVVPDLYQPVVVYCLDEDCDASMQAATLMDRLGYSRVHDYEAGKSEWRDARHPVER